MNAKIYEMSKSCTKCLNYLIFPILKLTDCGYSFQSMSFLLICVTHLPVQTNWQENTIMLTKLSKHLKLHDFIVTISDHKKISNRKY